mgnify:CR=1 FL=1
MKKILVFTSSRADFGLLKNLILKLKQNYKTDVVVSGTHLSNNFGYTFQEIEKSKIKIFKKIKWKNFNDSYKNICKNFSYNLEEISKILNSNKFNLVVLLGDRYETLSVAIAAHLARVPIAHIHGGELTNGIVDDAFRHSITKLSHIHFVSHIDYKKRIIQLGEDPKNIHVVGGLGIESIIKTKLIKKVELEKILKFKFKKKNMIINFHPETLSPNLAKYQIDQILNALRKFKNINKIFTMPGADLENNIIVKKIKKFIKLEKNSFLYESFGQKIYFSLIQNVDLMLGNSSSGILEMPYFGKLTINLGERQSGRVKAKSIIDLKIKKEDIIKTINKFYSGKFRLKLKKKNNLYGEGKSSKIILKKLKNEKFKTLLNKRFLDL